MADEQNTQQQNISAAPSQAENSGNTVPYDRFKEVNDKYRAMEQRLAQMEQEQSQKREKELAEQQRWQELAQELQAKLDATSKQAERATELEQSLQATVAARVERLPESVRTLVPDYSDPRLTLDWLNKNEALLVKAPAPSTDAGVAGDASAMKAVKLTELEMLIAQKAGMTPEQYAKRKAEGQARNEAAPTSTSDVLRKLEEAGHLSL